jgi:xanthine dehydrogenase YagT iron-sulfur-binding subunit
MLTRPADLPPILFRNLHGDPVPLVDPRGGPVVLVMSSDAVAYDVAAGDALRAELRGLGASLVVSDAGGTWRMQPDDPVDRLAIDGDRFAELAAMAGGAPLPWLTVLVVDATGSVRFRHVERTAPAGGDDLALAAVLDALRASARAARAGGSKWLPINRRDLIVGSMVAAFGLVLASGCRLRSAARDPAPPPGRDIIEVTLDVNGRAHALAVEPRVTLLDALRERLGLTGTKKGCDHGQCGACTVLVDGRATLSCLTLTVMQDGARITTIEGVARGGQLHPMQAAFISHDAYQCGYCTPGQILSAIALVAARRGRTDDDIREHMSGNLCRCGAYPNIVAAVRQVHGPEQGR